MKINLIAFSASIVLGLFFSCSAPENKTTNSEANNNSDLEEITSFIETRVMVYDTMQWDNYKDQEFVKTQKEERKGRFLSDAALEILKKQLKQTFNDPNAMIYFAANSDSIMSLKDRRGMYLICDSLQETNVDEKGKEVVKTIFMCDSTSFWDRMTTVRFYESWHYNKRTGEIVKKQLGYSILQWDENKEAFREPYVYFTSKEAKQIVIKNY